MESQSLKVAKLTVVAENIEQIASQIIDSVFKVHNYFGSGLLESIYEKALCKEFDKRKISYARQVPIPVFYDGEELGEGFRADIVIEKSVLVELKACEKLLPVHRAQTLSYMRLANKPLGFLINFNVPVIKNGIVRIINDRFEPEIVESQRREDAKDVV